MPQALRNKKIIEMPKSLKSPEIIVQKEDLKVVSLGHLQ